MENRPLEGIKILDLSRLLPGPLCTMHLADLGADVIKIEEPGTGDYARAVPPISKNTSTFFLTVNRNKRSVTLDLRSEKGREVFLRMVEGAHVVVESFRPGVLDKLNLSFKVLQERNPAIILCSITGYGQTGPYKDKAGHDLNYIALAGVLRPHPREGGKPGLPNFQMGDIVGGAQNAVMGILAAIISQKSNGAGRHLDVAMLDGLLANSIVSLSQKDSAALMGMDTSDLLNGLLPCYNVYETKDKKYVALGALEFKFWVQFCNSVGKEDLVSRHMAMGDEAGAVFDELDILFASKTRDEWVKELEGADCCFSPVNTLEEALRDPQVVHRDLVKRGDHSEEGAITYFDMPVRAGSKGTAYKQAPMLGEHTVEVLKELGYDDQSIADMAKAGIT